MNRCGKQGSLLLADLLWLAGLLWRAGLPRVGLRSSPNKNNAFIQANHVSRFLGRLRHPTRGKPARHNRPARR